MADDSDLSSSEDEKTYVGGAESESVARKKMLEGFYGKTAVAAAAPTVPSADSDDEEDHLPGRATDLDSSGFNVKAYVEPRVIGSSVHDLLEDEEQLALKVRTLDSTMQTLVYDNYSRFIDATDAIKSISVTVQANESGIKKLVQGMKSIDYTSAEIESSLGALRDQVVEKMRVKRLLQRLDSLLRLPQTLRQSIEAGRFTSATRDYLSAASILAKHSGGFESLKSIEVECGAILQEMKATLDLKLLHWSGKSLELENAPDAPGTMSGIFECVGSLVLLSQGDDSTMIIEYQGMAVAAAQRYLERSIDGHLFDVQERRHGELHDVGMNLLDAKSKKGKSPLVPSESLQELLQGISMFHSTFKKCEDSFDHMTAFLTEGFSSFLHHTKSVLLDETSRIANAEENDEGDGTFADIAVARRVLVQSVQDFVESLQSTEIVLSDSIISGLVTQATELSEMLVKMRVEQQFCQLRLSVAKDCLLPFSSNVTAERLTFSGGNKEYADACLQQANSMLSDCMQLVDDSIRSILTVSPEHESSDEKTTVSDLRLAVDESASAFGFWLANSIEVLAAGQSFAASQLLVVPKTQGEVNVISSPECSSETHEALGREQRQSEKELLDQLDVALNTFVGEQPDGYPDSGIILLLAQLCSLAESTVSNAIQQSIASHAGFRKKTKGLFPSGQTTGESEDPVERRFGAARSTVVRIYAISVGAAFSDDLCSEIENVSFQSAAPTGPSAYVSTALAIIKQSCQQIHGALGDQSFATKVVVPDEAGLALRRELQPRKTGLQLDVERMFKERVLIYPHPTSPMNGSRNSIIYLVLKMGLKSWIEEAKMLQFSKEGIEQLCVDIAVVRQLKQHYISETYSEGGMPALEALSTLLDDMLDVIHDRSVDFDANDHREQNQQNANRACRRFIESILVEGSNSFFTLDES